MIYVNEVELWVIEDRASYTFTGFVGQNACSVWDWAFLHTTDDMKVWVINK